MSDVILDGSHKVGVIPWSECVNRHFASLFFPCSQRRVTTHRDVHSTSFSFLSSFPTRPQHIMYNIYLHQLHYSGYKRAHANDIVWMLCGGIDAARRVPPWFFKT